MAKRPLTNNNVQKSKTAVEGRGVLLTYTRRIK